MEPITTVASVAAIVAVVNFLKRLGLKPELALALTIVLGVAFFVAEGFLAGTPAWTYASNGLLAGLAAAGTYDIAKTVSPTIVEDVAPGSRTVDLDGPQDLR